MVESLMRIRNYKKTDFDDILDINNKTFSGVERPPIGTLREMISISDTWVATAEEGDTVDPRVVAFAIVKPAGHDGSGQSAYLWQMSTTPDLQHRGIGGNLLREVIGYYTSKKYANVRLHVHPDNPAQKLYFDYGFRVFEIAHRFYDDGIGLYMKRRLS